MSVLFVFFLALGKPRLICNLRRVNSLCRVAVSDIIFLKSKIILNAYDNKKLERYSRLSLPVYKYKTMSRVYWEKYKIQNNEHSILEKYNRVCLIPKSTEFSENKKKIQIEILTTTEKLSH